MVQPFHIPGIYEPPPPPVDVPQVFFSIFICVLGLLGNLVAIFVILVLREYKKSVTHWYVLQLAIADSLFLLTLPFKANEDINNGWIYPDWMCKAKETILFLNYYASILFLVIMSIDRYIAVCHTFSSTVQKLRTQTSALIITIAVWSVSLLFCIPVMLFSFKTGNAPFCHCSYEFPRPIENTTADCVGERFTTPDDLRLCLLVRNIKEVDDGEPYCRQFNVESLKSILGSGGGLTESGEEMTVEELSNVDDYETSVYMSGSGNGSFSFDNNEPQSSGEFAGNNTNSRLLIPETCHYWNHPLGWKVFVLFNFLIMFVLPFMIMLVCYGLIIQRLSQSKIRPVSVKSNGSQKKKPSSRSAKDRKRVTIMCAALVSCFLICWLPFHAIHLGKFIGIYATDEVCVTLPKIGALLAFLNSALNPYLYSFLGTNFSKRWKLLKQSRGIQQFVSLAMWKQNDHSSSGHPKDVDRTSKHGIISRYKRQQSSDNKISTQRPTLMTRIAKENDYSQTTPSLQTADIFNEKPSSQDSLGTSSSSKYSQNSSPDEMQPMNGKY